MQSQISAYAYYGRTPVLQLKQRTDDFPKVEALEGQSLAI
jgi:hypothetical protein